MDFALAAPVLPGLDLIWKIFVFLVTLSVLVVLHELGHFVLARRNGVRVNDFAVGFGPTLLKWTSPRSGTNYRLNVLPLGGYCAMLGEDGNKSEAENERAFRERPFDPEENFQAKKPWQRLAIIAAGPIANFLVAFVLLFALALTFGVENPEAKSTTQIGPVQAGSPAAKAGLTFGDVILSIDGVPYADGDAMVKKIRGSAGKPLRIVFERGASRRSAVVRPQAVSEGGATVGKIGFQRMYPWVRVGPLEATSIAGLTIWSRVDATVHVLGDLVIHPSTAIANVAGPIGMGRAATQIIAVGPQYYLMLAANISIALGFFNLLPIPALDGGRGLFILVEMVRGRPIDPEREAFVHVAGFAALMMLMIFVAYHDIANIVRGQGVL